MFRFNSVESEKSENWIETWWMAGWLVNVLDWIGCTTIHIDSHVWMNGSVDLFNDHDYHSVKVGAKRCDSIRTKTEKEKKNALVMMVNWFVLMAGSSGKIITFSACKAWMIKIIWFSAFFNKEQQNDSPSTSDRWIESDLDERMNGWSDFVEKRHLISLNCPNFSLSSSGVFWFSQPVSHCWNSRTKKKVKMYSFQPNISGLLSCNGCLV